MVVTVLALMLAVSLGLLTWAAWRLRHMRQQYRVLQERAGRAESPPPANTAPPPPDPEARETRPSVDTVRRRSTQELARAEAELTARNHALSVLNRVIFAATRTFDLPRLMTTICHELAAAFDVPQVAAALIDWERGTFTVQAEYRADAARPSALGVHFPLDNNPVLDYMVAHKAPLAIADIRTDERLAFTGESRQNLVERGTVSMLIVPLLVENAVVGTIGIDSTVPREFTPDEINLAENIARALSQALHNTRLIARLHASEARLKAQFDNAPLGIVLITPEGVYQDCNTRWLEMVGYSRDELTARRHFDLIHPDDCGPAGCTDQLEALVRGEVLLYTIEQRFVRQDGSFFWASVSASPLRDQTGAIAAVIQLIADITERKKAEAERELLISELDAFAHTVAHDLKNPLGAVLGYTDILQYEIKQAGQAGSPIENYAHAIERATMRMNGIIDELLMLSQVRSTEDIMTHRLAMDVIVASTLERLHHLVEQHHAEIVITREDWPIAEGYGPWIEEVWANYISNAIKYGGSPPRIELGADRTTNDAIRFWVQDNGPGIPPDDQAQLFMPFTRLHTRQQSGHGLGLSIVKRIVDKLNGTVGLESKPDMGTRFYFTLPATTSTPEVV